ncbi:MAG: hypothetical protein RSD57_15275 [Comamonas sp.]
MGGDAKASEAGTSPSPGMVLGVAVMVQVALLAPCANVMFAPQVLL